MTAAEINEPLKQFKTHLKDEFDKSARELIATLILRSSVDATSNASRVRALRRGESALLKDRKRVRLFTFFKWTLLLICIAAFCVPLISLIKKFFPSLPLPQIPHKSALISGAICLFTMALAAKLSQSLRTFKKRIKELQARQEESLATAWEQMKPLNDLLEWSTIPKLIEKTLPIFTLDPFFSERRLEQLIEDFGLNDENAGIKSALFCQSGTINGNPFVICHNKVMHILPHTYTGSLDISWQVQESYTDSTGVLRFRTVVKHQRLTAEITKPEPVYSTEKVVIYANEAAGDLSFSRSPTELSSDTGLFASRRLKRRIASLVERSESLDGFMIMSDRKFDALFNALDRDDETQFRLLYTPLAQRETRLLLCDKSIGYGDDFNFTKRKMINVIEPSHLADIDILCAPKLFKNYDLAALRDNFIEQANNYFRAFFFAFAPLLAIPLYQQRRPKSDLEDDSSLAEASSWECESLANEFGDEAFRHPESVTEHILKATNVGRIENGYALIEISAYGYKTVERLDYARKLGGDGHLHDVPVHWLEYLPVCQTSHMVIKESKFQDEAKFKAEISSSREWEKLRNKFSCSADGLLMRRSIAAFIAKNMPQSH